MVDRALIFEGSRSIYATISTWTLDRELQDPQAVVALLRDLATGNAATMLAAGMLDAVALYLQPDCLIGIAIYATLAEAFAIGPQTRDQVTARCGTTLRRERRVVGVLFHSLLPDESDLAWRANAPEMYATWVTWRVGPELRSDEALERYIAEGYRHLEPTLRRLGLVDGMVIRYADDEMAVLNLYADPVQGHSGYQEAMSAVTEYAAGTSSELRHAPGGPSISRSCSRAPPESGQPFRPASPEALAPIVMEPGPSLAHYPCPASFVPTYG
jgi:hypothetical protein